MRSPVRRRRRRERAADPDRGRTALKRRGRGAVQDIDQEGMLAPVAKWRAVAFNPQTLQRLTDEAFHQAASGRPGRSTSSASRRVHGPAGAGPGHWGFPASPTRPLPRRLSWSGRSSAQSRVPPRGAGRQRQLLVGRGRGDRRPMRCAEIPVTTTSAARACCRLAPLCSAPWSTPAPRSRRRTACWCWAAPSTATSYMAAPLFNDEQLLIQVDIAGDQVAATGARHRGAGRRPRVVAQMRQSGLRSRSGRAGWSRARAGRDLAADVGPADRRYRGALVHPVPCVRSPPSRAKPGRRVHPGGGRGDTSPGRRVCGRRGPGRLLSTTTALGTLASVCPSPCGQGGRPDEPVVLITGDGAFGLSAMEMDTPRVTTCRSSWSSPTTAAGAMCGTTSARCTTARSQAPSPTRATTGSPKRWMPRRADRAALRSASRTRGAASSGGQP